MFRDHRSRIKRPKAAQILVVSNSHGMQHFMECDSYGRKKLSQWSEIYENDSSTKIKIEIAQEVHERKKIRDNIIQKDGLAQDLAQFAPLL